MNDGDVSLAKVLMRSIAFSRSTNSFLQMVVHSVLRGQQARAFLIALLGDESRLVIQGNYGFSQEFLDFLSSSDPARNPLQHVLNKSIQLKINTEDSLLEQFPSFKIMNNLKYCSIIFPFETQEGLLGVGWLAFDEAQGPNPLNEVELELIKFAAELAVTSESTRKLIQRTLSPYSKQLDVREKDVLKLVKMGLTNYQIAKRLNISESWVKKINQSIFRKLEISSRREIINEKNLPIEENMSSSK